MDEERLQEIADRLAGFIIARCAGFSVAELNASCRDFRRLDHAEKFRVQVLLAKNRRLSSLIGVRGSWWFFPRSVAPQGAFNIRDAKRLTAGEIIDAAGRK